MFGFRDCKSFDGCRKDDHLTAAINLSRGTTLEKRILLGHIASAHGIKGEVMVRTYTETPEGLMAYGPLDGEAGEAPLTITAARASAKGTICRIEGIGDRTAAEGLRGRALYVDRSRMPDADAGSYYHTDLIGLTALDAAGAAVGKIAGVENYGAGDLIVIDRGAGTETLVLPFTDRFVPEVDIKAGRVTVNVPDMVGDAEPTGADDHDDIG